MRAAGKKLIGAQASAAIWAGVDEWLVRNPSKSTSDFVLEACMEKLDAEKIEFDRAGALFDGRRRVPRKMVYPPHRPSYLVMNEKPKASSSASGAAGRLLKKGAAAVVKPVVP